MTQFMSLDAVDQASHARVLRFLQCSRERVKSTSVVMSVMPIALSPVGVGVGGVGGVGIGSEPSMIDQTP